MKLQNQVVPVEQAKKLKELGVLQSSYFKHCRNAYQEHFNLITPSFLTDSRDELLAAYTVAELGVMLPEFSYSWRGRGVNDENYACVTSDQPPSDDEIDYLLDKCEVAIKKTEAEARAAKLIQKIESGELTAAEVNERLKNA